MEKIYKKTTKISILLDIENPKLESSLERVHLGWSLQAMLEHSWKALSRNIQKTQDSSYQQPVDIGYYSDGKFNSICTMQVNSENGLLFKDACVEFERKIKEVQTIKENKRNWERLEKFSSMDSTKELHAQLNRAKAVEHWVAVEKLIKEISRRIQVDFLLSVTAFKNNFDLLEKLELETYQQTKQTDQEIQCKEKYTQLNELYTSICVKLSEV